jgi:hypothetical protein
MNANDIAEELESIHWLQDGAKSKPFQMYADFIRQQQAEIEALKDKIMMEEENYMLLDEESLFAKESIKQQQAEIEALKDKLYLAKQSLDIVDGWIGKAQEKC